MSHAVDLLVNPADTASMYAYFADGSFRHYGAAIPIVNDGNRGAGFVDGAPPSAFDDPTGGPFLRAQIVDWATASGYIFDAYGIVWAFGPDAVNTDEFGALTSSRRNVDFIMNPLGTGDGYVLRSNGSLRPIGGAPVIASTQLSAGRRAHRLFMDWTTKEYWIQDTYGAFHARHGAPTISVDGLPVGAKVENAEIAAGAVFLDILTGEGWSMNTRGQIRTLNGTDEVHGGPIELRAGPVWMDLGLLEDGAGGDPLRFAVLSNAGFPHEFTISSAPTLVMGGGGDSLSPPALEEDTSRPEIAWEFVDPDDDRQAQWELRVISGAIYNEEVGTANEVKTITVDATGGTWRVDVEGFWIDPIAENATGATFQTALEALPNVEPGDVEVVGDGPYTLTFKERLGKYDVGTMEVDESLLTGGASTVTVVVTTQGSLGTGDPELLPAVYTASGTDPLTRSHRVGIDLSNITYRAYMRAIDSAGDVSKWYQRQFTLDVDVADLPTPEVVAVQLGNGVPGVGILIELGASPDEDVLACVLYRDFEADDWHFVRDGHNLVPDPDDGTCGVTDPEAPLDLEREYVAFAYQSDPFRAGTPSEPLAAITAAEAEGIFDDPILVWDDADALFDDEGHTTGIAYWAISAPWAGLRPLLVEHRLDEQPTRRPVQRGKFVATGRRNAIVLRGGVKGAEFTLPVRCHTEDRYRELVEFLETETTFQVRGPEREWYVDFDGDLDDLYHRGNWAELDLPFVEVDRPDTGPFEGPLLDTAVV